MDLCTVLARFAYTRCGSSGEWTYASYWPGLTTQGVGHPESGLVHHIGKSCLSKVGGHLKSGLVHCIGQV